MCRPLIIRGELFTDFVTDKRVVKMKRIIERTGQFVIFQDNFEGNVLTLRKWHREAKEAGVEIKLDDTFAKCCGYNSKDELIAKTIGEQGKQNVIALFGYFPEWVRIFTDGRVCFVGEGSTNGEA